MTTPYDPDLAIDAGAFEAFAEAVVAAVLAPLVDAGGVTTVAAEATAETAAESGGSVIAGQGADALYTLPDGSVSFSGYGIDGTSYSFS